MSRRYRQNRRRRIAAQNRERRAWHAELAAMLKAERALAALTEDLGLEAARLRWAAGDASEDGRAGDRASS